MAVVDGDRERVLQQLLENTREGVWFIDNQTRTIDVNPAMCRILGRPREEIVGRTIYEFVDDANAEVFRREIRARKSGKLGTYEIELHRADGSNIPCVNNASPIYDVRGQKIASIGLWTDISEIKQYQELLLQAKEGAESASRAKSEFLSSMSHELRTPLHAILGFAELLASDPEHPLDQSQQDRVERISRSGDHLLRLIDDVLDLAKIENGAVSVDIQTIKPADLLEHCADLAQAIADKRGISVFNRSAGKKLAPIRADPTRLQQVLLNLLSNGIKYNRDNGSVILDCDAWEPGTMRFSVRDTGPGIPEASQGELFRPFSRLGMENGPVQGAGIGLVICRRLIEQMGGSINFESRPGMGSVFSVDVPCAAEAELDPPEHCSSAREATATEVPPRSKSPGLVGLYIEDNPDLVRLLEDALSLEMNLELLSAHDAEVGLVLAEREKPDIIIMDINLPGIDGLAALRQLRANPITEKIPVIAFSGSPIRRNTGRGHEADFDGYLMKPFKMKDAVSAISQLLARGDAVQGSPAADGSVAQTSRN